MKLYLLLILFLFTSICKAEHKIKLYFEPSENGYNIYADNMEFCQMSVKIEFTIDNLRIKGGNNKIYVVDPQKNKQLLTQLTVYKKEKAYKFSFNYWTNYGNHYKSEYDSDYAYNLPFGKLKSYFVDQGYNGDFSHQKEYALDFTMPIGTEITAIREGTVVKVIEENIKNCEEKDCIKFNNLIIIYHPDGTFVEYTHIKQNGSAVNVGDIVAQGQIIGYSGNVGWSTGPHLHLVVFLQKFDKSVTLKTKFRTGSGKKNEYLVAKNEYLRDY